MAQPLMMCFGIHRQHQQILELTVGPGPMIVAKNSKMAPNDPVELAWTLTLLVVVLDLRMESRSH
jgi:hypothetical protein